MVCEFELKFQKGVTLLANLGINSQRTMKARHCVFVGKRTGNFTVQLIQKGRLSQPFLNCSGKSP
jgi:hypothetical protein